MADLQPELPTIILGLYWDGLYRGYFAIMNLISHHVDTGPWCAALEGP